MKPLPLQPLQLNLMQIPDVNNSDVNIPDANKSDVTISETLTLNSLPSSAYVESTRM